ncbi:hypothetical protein BZG36_00232 [Bifiguratus adelaidae]|uniref:Laccase n=1 Tax=Bifiguratus adelaidae TaxID=1938954 RepID=A0A261Y8H4_9FUNG|nr:hypothetical protein BZG36_00232 [Bifiguratus adelaidae]
MVWARVGVLATLLATACAAIQEYTFTVSEATITPDDYARPGALIVNGQYPGPKIEVNTGDIVRVTVNNNLTTQCPIPAGGSYTYEFSTEGQSGTYWWHSHYMSQYVDGILGPLIIHNATAESQVLPYDEELVISLSDWYHTPAPSLVTHYLSRSSKGEEPTPDNALINGKMNNGCKLYVPPGTSCNPNATLSEFTFVPGKKYRLRLINTSAFANFHFSIDNHTLTVIEADGTDIKPLTVDRIPINVAQRYSVVVKANQKPQGYYMRAQIDIPCAAGGDVGKPAVSLATALVNYQGGANTFNGSVNKKDHLIDCQDLDYKVLRPYYAQNPPSHPSQLVTLNFGFQLDPNTAIKYAYINNQTYMANFTNPTLLNIWSNQLQLSGDQYIININNAQWVDLLLTNNDASEHPFSFPRPHILRFGNPLRRDTSTIPPTGWTYLRFLTDNPGVWALHCHIQGQMEAGLSVQIVENPAAIRRLPIPADNLALCSYPYKQVTKRHHP